MGYSTFALELEVQVQPKRMWYACVKDADKALPKMIPEHFASIEYIGGCGCAKGSVREVNHGKAFQYVSSKETFLEVDHRNYYAKIKVVEGGVVDKLFHHHVQALNFVKGSRGENSCYVRWCLEYDAMGSRKFHETFKKEAVRIVKLVEKYLTTHNDYTNVSD